MLYFCIGYGSFANGKEDACYILVTYMPSGAGDALCICEIKSSKVPPSIDGVTSTAQVFEDHGGRGHIQNAGIENAYYFLHMCTIALGF